MITSSFFSDEKLHEDNETEFVTTQFAFRLHLFNFNQKKTNVLLIQHLFVVSKPQQQGPDSSFHINDLHPRFSHNKNRRLTTENTNHNVSLCKHITRYVKSNLVLFSTNLIFSHLFQTGIIARGNVMQLWTTQSLNATIMLCACSQPSQSYLLCSGFLSSLHGWCTLFQTAELIGPFCKIYLCYSYQLTQFSILLYFSYIMENGLWENLERV